MPGSKVVNMSKAVLRFNNSQVPSKKENSHRTIQIW